jgi:hypothetical protein
MFMRSLAALVLGISLFTAFAPAQSQNAAFDGQSAHEYIKVLASDAMQGRMSGEPGGRMAAEYIVSKLAGWGLEPAGPKGSYYQDMTYEYYAVRHGAALNIIAHNAKREFVYGDDWRQQRYSGSGTFGAGIVFVGYGISAAQKEYDDYSGVDVKDKLVLFATETPRRFEEKLAEEARFQNRIKAAREHGARGVLTFRSETPDGPGFRGFRGDLKKENYKSDFVIISLERSVVDFIFKWQKADPRQFLQQIETTGKPQSYELGVQSLVSLDIVFDEKRPTQNILARIPGTDAGLKNEYVIIGAHMDHLGVDMTGDVFNGADDNASGTAVVMEAARVMKLRQFKPGRTILFALWAAEEEGLLGSKFYTENPVYPLEKTIANINLDMEGHGTGKINVRGSYFAPEVWEILKAGLPKEIVENSLPGRGGPGGSDHTYFLYNGVPAFFVATDGPHFKTNQVGDVIDLIKPEILKKAGDFVVAAAEVLGSNPKLPIQARRKETFYWRYETIINYRTPILDTVIEEHKDVQDPDVDFQLATAGEREGSNSDALRMEVMRSLVAGTEKLAQSKGLALYGGSGQTPMRFRMMGGGGPSKTTVLVGLHGIASIRDDLRWAEAFSRQGIAFVVLDQPALLFNDKALSDEGKKIMEALGKANVLAIVKGLDSPQAMALLSNSARPLMLQTNTLPDKEVLDLVKKTGSTVGMVLGNREDPASYARKIDEAKKAIGTEYLSIVSENCLWENEGKEQMLSVIAELLKAKHENEDLANLFSGAFMRALNRARAERNARP